MGATKSNNYSKEDLMLSLIARAISHPARIRMLRLLRRYEGYRNTDLVAELNLSVRSIHDHVQKFKDADLVTLHYLPHCYIVSLKGDGMRRLAEFLGE